MRYWYSSRYLLKNIIPLSGRKVKKNPSNLPKFSCWLVGKLGESLDISGGFAYNSKAVTLGDCKMLRIWVYRAVGFPRSMPSPCGAIRKRMRGTAKRWMRRAAYKSVTGVISLGLSIVSAYTRIKNQTRFPHPSLRDTFPAGEGK